MPIATPEVYNEMLDRAKAGKFAYPAINVTSTQTLHAALRGFAEAESDGIIQISTGGAEFLGGQYSKDMVTGAVALAEFAHIVAEKYPVNVALHTDHCPKDKLDGYVRPLLAVSAERVAPGENPLFQSHMWDGSAETLEDNLAIGQELLAAAAAAKIILEVEITPTGGEEDGVTHEINDELYTTVDDALRTAEALGLGEKGRYLLAASFGNVHGVYKPGNVVLRPELLKDLQEGVGAKYGKAAPFDFVFHGGSGSTARGDRHRAGERRREDEPGHRHPVRLHPARRGPHVPQLRRRAEGRRRGRQQEDLRPAQLGQGRRGGHGRAGHRGLREPALDRHEAEVRARVAAVRRPLSVGRTFPDGPATLCGAGPSVAGRRPSRGDPAGHRGRIGSPRRAVGCC